MDAFAPYEAAERGREQALQRAEAADACLRAAVDMLMAAPEGRTLLRWLLHQCRVFRAEDLGMLQGGDAMARLAFAEGRRLVGMRLMRLVQRSGASHLSQLLQTTEEDNHVLE